MQDGPVTRLVLIRRQIQSMDCSLSFIVSPCLFTYSLLTSSYGNALLPTDFGSGGGGENGGNGGGFVFINATVLSIMGNILANGGQGIYPLLYYNSLFWFIFISFLLLSLLLC